MSMREGSLCSGYNGLNLAGEEVLGTELAWYSEIDDAPAAVMAHHYPDVKNLGDLTALSWDTVPRVDVLTAGYPCQPFSYAGQRKGTNDERHLWPYIADAIRVLRPRLVILENVAGHLSLGFDVVLSDLARIGFDAEWRVVRASDVGACHQRARLFVVAADAEHLGLNGSTVGRGAGEGAGERRVLQPQGRGAEDAADADLSRPQGRGAVRRGGGERPVGAGGVASWGDYATAIARHAAVLGRPAPPPTDARGRLAPEFVEWMMMLPEGWVTDVLTSRTKALKCLGNGVVPPQAAYALRTLLAAVSEAA